MAAMMLGQPFKPNYDGPEHEQCRAENARYQGQFARWLEGHDIVQEVRESCLEDIDYFLNHYLLDVNPPYHMTDGPGLLDDYLGRYLIRDVDWSSLSILKSNVVSVWLFYQCMSEVGNVDEQAYAEVRKLIEDNEQSWYDEMEEYERLYGDDEDDEYDWELEAEFDEIMPEVIDRLNRLFSRM